MGKPHNSVNGGWIYVSFLAMGGQPRTSLTHKREREGDRILH